MPSRSIDDIDVSAGQVYYLDTSAVFPLTYFKLEENGGKCPPEEMRRAHRLFGLLDKIRATSAKARTTILAIEELATKTRNMSRTMQLQKNGYNKLDDVKTVDQKLAMEIIAIAHQSMVEMLKSCARALKDSGILLEDPAIADTDTLSLATQRRERFKNILFKYKGLDPMDALHITLGLELKATAFVSFDEAWHTISEISVIR